MSFVGKKFPNISTTAIDHMGDNFELNVLEQISDKLVELKIQSVLVEGGLRLLNDFIQQNLFDEIFVFEKPKLKFGAGLKAPQLNLVGNFVVIGEDKLYRFFG